jgi:long-chain acyl-CoA synthetase
VRDSLVQRFAAVASRRRDATSLRWRDCHWTFGRLADCIDRVGESLANRRFAPQTRIALLMRNCPQYVAAFYAVLRAGYVVVPLNAQERASVLLRQIEHSDAAMLICDSSHAEFSTLRTLLVERAIEVISVDLDTTSSAADSFATAFGFVGTAHEPAQTEAHDLAAIIYTSGTTGKPKGVMLSHGNLAANSASIIDYLELTAEDRGLCVLPFHFSYGNSLLHTHLLAGAELIVEDNFAFPHVAMQRIQEHRITGFAGVPATFAMMLARCQLQQFDLTSLRYITQAGGAMPRPTIERLHQQLPGAKIFIMYGQTEATARLTYLQPDMLQRKLGSVGKGLVDVEISVRDEEDRDARVNQIGEICAKGPNVMLGYWKDAAATSEVIRNGWLRTGDLGHWDEEGYLYIDGRVVEMIKVGAFRVSPQEVEEAVMSLEGVEQAAAIAIPDDLLGQAIKVVIVPASGASIAEMAVKGRCRQLLASYKVPKIVEFALELPRTASGKIQKFKL